MPTTKKPNSWFVQKLIEMGACGEAIRYAKKHRTFPAAWRECEYASWMRWLLQKLELLNLSATCPRFCCKGDDEAMKAIRRSRKFTADRVAKALRKWKA